MAPAIDDQDKRDKKLDVRTSETVEKLTQQAAREDGLSLSQWVMDLVLPELERRYGYVDTARRSAPRRPNYRQRQAETGGQQQ